MTLSIRRAAREDAPTLAVIELLTAPEFATFLLEDLFEGTTVGASLSTIYRRGGTDSYEWSWIANRDGDDVGAIGAYPVSLVQASSDTGEAADRLAYFDGIRGKMRADAFHISRLGVLEPFRRMGIARQLIDTACASAGAHGETRVTLFVWEDNAEAVGLYNALGFEQIDSVVIPAHPRMLRHGRSLLMSRAL